MTRNGFVCVSATVCVGGAGACAGGPGVGGDRRLPGQLHGRKFFPLLQWRGTACWGRQRVQHSFKTWWRFHRAIEEVEDKDGNVSWWEKIGVLLLCFFCLPVSQTNSEETNVDLPTPSTKR